MSGNSLKSTTAAVLIVALALPYPTVGLAQGKSGFRIGKDGEIKLNDGALKNRPCDLLAELRAEASERIAFEGLAEDANVAEMPDEECRTMIETAMAAGPGGETEAAEAEAAEPEAETEAGAEVAAEAEAGEAAEAVAETEAEAEATTQADSEVAAEAEAAPESEAEVAAEAEAAQNADTEVAAESEAPAQETEAEAPVAVTAQSPGQKKAKSRAKESGQTAEASQPEQELEVAQSDSEESTEAANATVAAEAATAALNDTGAAEAEAEVRTEVVTEETSRSSDEEFASAAVAEGAAATASGDDGGLSNLEKFALGALGVAIAGKILSQGDDVVSSSDDRLVVRRSDGNYYVLKDDNSLLRQPGVEVTTRTFDDGSTLQTALRPNGEKVVTIRAANGQVLRRSRVFPDGREIVLFDDTREVAPVDVSTLPEATSRSMTLDELEDQELRLALLGAEENRINRRFTLQQIRQIRAVRALVPTLELDAITFDTGSAVIRVSQAEELGDLGRAMRRAIRENPDEVFLIEGHTDATGPATMNLLLSDRRAESVALALTEYFDVPPENMVIQGYGESNLKIQTAGSERRNRRVTVRRITPLLAGYSN